MNVLEVLNKFQKYRKTYKNYLSVMWNVKRGRDIIKVVLKNGDVFQWRWEKVYLYPAYKENDMAKFNSFFTGVNIKVNENNLSFHGKQLNFTGTKNNGDLFGIFLLEDYSFLRCDGKDVVDIGANIGDSAIYFALNNAKRVIALEPYPHSYSSAEANVKNNDLGNVITLINAGYGDDSTIIVNEAFNNNVGSDLIASEQGINIPLYSLKSLIERYNMQSPVLKMDCEGCEYNLLNEADEVIKRFKRIQIEYHYGYEKLKSKLEKAGFEVTFTKPRNVYNSSASNPNTEVGFIYAENLTTSDFS